MNEWRDSMTVQGVLYFSVALFGPEKMFLSEGGYLEVRSSIFYSQLYNQTKLWSGRVSSLVDFHLSSSVWTLAQISLFFFFCGIHFVP